MRVVDAESLDALLDPADHHIAQGQPQRGHGLRRIEIDVDDVLVLFRRVFSVADGAVRAPAEPARVLLEPGVVLGALDGEIEGNFQAVFRRCGHQTAEVIAVAQLRVNGLVAAFRAADGIRAARVARLGLEGVVAALAMLHADGVDGREVQDVEAHVADHRQPFVHVVEGAVALRVVGHRAREQLVPAGEQGGRAIDIKGKLRAAGQVAAVFGFAHQAGGGRVEKDGYLVIGTEGGQAVLHGLELFAQGAAAQLDAFAQHQTAFFQLQFHLDAGVVLLLQVVAIGGKRVDPGLDTEQVRAQLGGGEFGLPQVVARRLHRHAMPAPAVRLAPVEHHRQAVVAVAVGLGADCHRLAADGLGGEAAGVEHGLGVFDHDAWRQQRLGQANGLVRVIVRHGHAFKGLVS
ncbi:hypothetical protein D3C79_619800 [compost metagenome]